MFGLSCISETFFATDDHVLRNTIWVCNGSIELSLQDRLDLINPEGWLSDNHMNAFHDLLKLKFPAAQGLQDTLLFTIQRVNNAVLMNSLESLRKRHDYEKNWKPDDRKMQTLLVGGNHWIVVTNQHPGSANLIVVCIQSR